MNENDPYRKNEVEEWLQIIHESNPIFIDSILRIIEATFKIHGRFH